MTEIRYVVRKGKVVQASEEETARIIELENRSQEEKDADALASSGEIRLQDLKQERDELLLQSDWTQVVDSPLSDTKKAEWATYRQELRDFPDTFKDSEGNLTLDILGERVWPTKPS